MKIRVESGERVVVEVPTQVASSACISIQAMPSPKVGSVSYPLLDVTIEDGLIGRVEEHVCRRQSSSNEDRLMLWAHLVSEHATCLGLDLSLAALIEIHEHEHDGPGTIRNHPREWRNAHIATIVTTLAESDSGLASMNDSVLRLHAKHVNDEVALRKED